MAGSDNFGVENGMGNRAVEWMNSYSKEKKMEFKAKLEGYQILSKNFGDFEIISWRGNWSDARKIIIKASTKLSMKVIESGYHQKDNLLISFFGFGKEFGKVYKKGNYIGTIVLGLRSGKWYIKSEKPG
ncbi:MAG: hypothetical protein E6K97_00540 [Thaumarchaeota archaeon]|nr:MAG: hypothetical protein E6K97_00540 [Nitrososphaerota archaeon]